MEARGSEFKVSYIVGLRPACNTQDYLRKKIGMRRGGREGRMMRKEEERRRRKEKAQDRKEDEKKDGEGRRGTAEEGRRPQQQWHTLWTPEASVVCVCIAGSEDYTSKSRLHKGRVKCVPPCLSQVAPCWVRRLAKVLF